MSAQSQVTVPVSSPDDAIASISGDRSTPVTFNPLDARKFVITPVPQPRSVTAGSDTLQNSVISPYI